jgi:hypothetical protein
MHAKKSKEGIFHEPPETEDIRDDSLASWSAAAMTPLLVRCCRLLSYIKRRSKVVSRFACHRCSRTQAPKGWFIPNERFENR